MVLWRGYMAEGCAVTLPVPYESGRPDEPTSGRTDGRTVDSDWSARWACRGAPVNQAFPSAVVTVRGRRTRRPILSATSTVATDRSPRAHAQTYASAHRVYRISCRDFLNINIQYYYIFLCSTKYVF